MKNKSTYKVPGVYITETDITIYSIITNKCYSSEKEIEKDIRKLKLEKLKEING